MASDYNNGENLIYEIGHKYNVFNNVTPYFDDERIHIFTEMFS